MEQCQLKISDRFAALENVDGKGDINRARGSFRETS
jgi:hypothetical protein